MSYGKRKKDAALTARKRTNKMYYGKRKQQRATTLTELK